MRLYACVVLLLATMIGCQSSSARRAEKARRAEANQVAQLEADIYALEQRRNAEQKEIRETLDRLRTNRVNKIGRIRRDLRAAVDTFEAGLEEVRLAKGGEHHGE